MDTLTEWILFIGYALAILLVILKNRYDKHKLS